MLTGYEIWKQVTEAIQTDHTVRLSYIKKAGILVGYEVVPIDIFVKIRADGRRMEYLFGHRLDLPKREQGRRTERQFLLDRILSLQITNHLFNPSDFVDLSGTRPRWLIPRTWKEAA